MLIKIEEKKGTNGEKTKAAINEIRQNGIMALTKIKFSIEQLWTNGLENTQTLLQFKELFKELLDKLETAEEELRVIFSNLVSVTRIIVDPAVKLLVQMIESKPLDEQRESKQKLIDGFVKRDKLLGHVMGRLIYAQLENTEIDDMFILEPLTKLLRELNDEFYDKART